MQRWLFAFVGAHVHGDVIDVLLQANERIFELVDAVGEWGVRAVVMVQLILKLPRDANELAKPVHECVLSFVQGERPPSCLAPGPAVRRGGVPGTHAVLSRGGCLHGVGRRSGVLHRGGE